MAAPGGTKVSRRTALVTTASAALALLPVPAPAWMSPFRAPAAADRRQVGGSSRPHAAAAPDWTALAKQVQGPVLRPGDGQFRAATRTFDPRRDGLTPAAIVQVASEADVSVTLAFAQRYGLAVRPRAGGHSYVGASTGNGVLVIDTRRLDAVSWSADSSSVWVGAGAALGALHKTLDTRNRTVPTGTCPTVGLAGLALGGGIGAESRLYGLTLDAITAIRIVTPDGRVRQVSAKAEPGLFWALRGAGGGNFGIATRFQLKTFPSRSAEFFFLRWAPSAAVQVLRGWQQRLGTMPKTSWANVHLEAAGGSAVPRVVGVSWGASGRAEAQALIAAVGVQPVSVSYASRSHAGAVDLLAGPAGAQRQSWLAGSDVISEPWSVARAQQVVAVVRARAAARRPGALILDPLDGAVRAGSTSTSSFPWRRALASLQWYVSLPSSPSQATVDSGRAFVRSGHTALSTSSIGGYINYLEPGRALRTYYGGSWAKLLTTNRTYDPAGLFSSSFSLPG